MAELPHVTAILRDAGLVDVSFFTNEARDRGTAVHLATRYHDEGDLDPESLDATVRPRFDAYTRFLEEVRPEILAIEQFVENTVHGYCGTYDRLLVINGRRGILDIKGTTASEWHGPQLAAYAACVPGQLSRWNLYLRDDDYRLIERKNRDDWSCFRAALTLVNWRRNNAA